MKGDGQPYGNFPASPPLAGMPGGPPPGGQRPRSRGFVWMMMGGVLAIAIVITTVVVFVAGGDDEPPGSAADSRQSAGRDGSMRGTYKQVTGYDLATGKQRWKVDAPANQAFCGMSRAAPNGLGAVILGKSGNEDTLMGPVDQWRCETVWVIDVRAGRWRSQAQFPKAKDYTQQGDDKGHPEVIGDAIIVRNGREILSFGLSDGKFRGRIGGFRTVLGPCQPKDMLPGRTEAIVLVDCRAGKRQGGYVVWVSPKGKIRWSDKLRLGKGLLSMHLLSASPPVVMVPGGLKPKEGPKFVTLNESGKVASRISRFPGFDKIDDAEAAQIGDISARLPEQTTKRFSALASNGTLVVRADRQLPEGQLPEFSDVLAFDLATGKLRWSRHVDSDRSTPVALTMDSVILLGLSASASGPMRAHQMSLKDGTTQVVSPNFAKGLGEDFFTNPPAMFYWHDNKIYAVRGGGRSMTSRGTPTAVYALS